MNTSSTSARRISAKRWNTGVTKLADLTYDQQEFSGGAMCVSRLQIENSRRIKEAELMYVIDLTHYLDSRGAIASARGPAQKMADFLTAVVAHASDFDRPDDAPGPLCFKCRKRDQRVVDTDVTEGDVVVWRCLACGTEGQISNWQGTFWDLRHGTPSS